MNWRRKIYRAERDGTAVCSDAEEVARVVGCRIARIHERSFALRANFRSWPSANLRARRRGKSVKGWKISVEPARFVRVYAAEKDGEDPIVGPAEEVAALLGLAEGTIERNAQTGVMSREGWKIRAVPGERMIERRRGVYGEL